MLKRKVMTFIFSLALFLGLQFVHADVTIKYYPGSDISYTGNQSEYFSGIGTITITDGDDTITIMDRNIGATKAGTLCDNSDSGACGWHFQWGNNHGFERTCFENLCSDAVSSTSTSTRVSWNSNYIYDGYYGVKFIKGSYASYFSDGNLHAELRGGLVNDTYDSSQGEDKQGPCPDGFHVPSYGEWQMLADMYTGKYGTINSSNYSNFQDAFYFSLPGFRRDYDVVLSNTDNVHFWSSSLSTSNSNRVKIFKIDTNGLAINDDQPNVYGFSVRCFYNYHENYSNHVEFYNDGVLIYSGDVRNGEYLDEDILSQLNIVAKTGWTTNRYISGTNTIFDILNDKVEDDMVLNAKYSTVGVITYYPNSDVRYTLNENEYFTGVGTITISNGYDTITMMDRNLGATKAGTVCNSSDSGACGYHFQWGNNYGFALYSSLSTTLDSPVNTEQYGPGNFYNSGIFRKITRQSNNAWDWSSPHNDNLRGGIGDTTSNSYPVINATDRQGPCPDGFHVPSYGEWDTIVKLYEGTDEIEYGLTSDVEGFHNSFYVPYAGHHNDQEATLGGTDSETLIWLSSPVGNNSYVYNLRSDSSANNIKSMHRTYGFSVRCVYDKYEKYGYHVALYDRDTDTLLWSGDVQSGQKISDEVVNLVNTKTGYSLNGWYISGTDTIFDIENDVITEDIILESTWDRILYAIKFNNRNGAQLLRQMYYYGDMPEYPYSVLGIPTRTSDGQYDYTFLGWEPSISIVTGTYTYTATYIAAIRSYIVTWLDGDGQILKTETLQYGIIPSYSGTTPTKTADAQYTYTFNNTRSPEIHSVTGDTMYIAQFTGTINQYEITFVDRDGTTIKETELYDYGTPASTISPISPERANTAQYTYTFAGWSPSITTVTQAQVYTATYNSTVNTYDVIFDSRGGDYTPATQSIEYGSTATRPTDPIKIGYTLLGWYLSGTENEFNFSTTITENIDLYAGWTCADGYHLEDGVCTGNTKTVACTESGKPENSSYIPGNIEITRDSQTQTRSEAENCAWICDTHYHTEDNLSCTENTKTVACTESGKPENSSYIPGNIEITRDSQTQTRSEAENCAWICDTHYHTGTNGGTCELDTYTITWKNDDGSVIDTTVVEYGVVPTHADATKVADNTYTYAFAGWTPEVMVATADATYTATFTPNYINYTITFVNYDDSVLSTSGYHYGDSVTAPTNPSKPSNNTYDYSFVGWDSEVTTVNGNKTYKAVYSGTYIPYTITWKDYDGTVLSGATYHYNDDLEVLRDPTRSADNTYSYEFSGWSPAISTKVTESKEYTATYTPTYIEYTITFNNWDGEFITSGSYHYGDIVVAPTNPSRPETAEYTYVFSGWSPEVVAVEGDAEYTATFTANLRSYTVRFYDENGITVLDAQTVAYGTTPVYGGATPTKEADAQYTYTFSGWSPTLYEVNGEQEYTATYSSVVNEYMITWKDGDGNTLKTEEVAYGQTPTYVGTTPTKTATAQYTYAFNNTWSPAPAAVTGDATYTAQFDSTTNEYTITWNYRNADGELASSTDTIAYGETPTAPSLPGMSQSVSTVYMFTNWSPEISSVIGETTYEAQYTEIAREYTVTFTVIPNGYGIIDPLSIFAEYGSQVNTSGNTVTIGQTIYTANPIASNEQYTYNFLNWTNNCGESITGICTIIANFDRTVNVYTVLWKNEDGVVLEADEGVAYGMTPSYNGDIPEKEQDEEYTYSFVGWNPEISEVHGNQEYIAIYNSTKRSYEITWLDEDDSQIDTTIVEYGQRPTHADPSKDTTSQYTYIFAGWSPKIETVTGNTTYKATYSSIVNKYVITFVDELGVELYSGEVEYGVMPTYLGETPTKAETEQYRYEFDGWNPGIETVTGDMTYVVKWKEISKSNQGGNSGGGYAGGGAGGGGGSTLKKDKCPDGDCSDSYYDLSCGELNEDGSCAECDTDEIGQNNSAESEDLDEQQSAYERAYKNGITTMPTIEQADMGGTLTRIAMAKMLSQYAINVLGKEPDTSKTINFKDVSNKMNSEYNDGVSLAYQLGIMGINMPNNKFRPYDEVTRAEFVTALSRMKYGTDDGQEIYYSTHMNLLKDLGIITNTDPYMKELRGYVMLMLMRSEKNN